MTAKLPVSNALFALCCACFSHFAMSIHQVNLEHISTSVVLSSLKTSRTTPI